MSSDFTNQSFAPTRWTLVLRSCGGSEQARAALSELCEIYYRPAIGFLRAYCGNEETAQEIAHEFFARLLEKGGFENVDPARGKFRSYLLGALKHFVHEKRKYERRQKRGGGVSVESIDAPVELEESEIQPQFSDESLRNLDLYFDKEWALTVVGRALKSVEERYKLEGKFEQYEVLKLWLTEVPTELNQKSAAEKLGISETAVKVAIHRLRKRFREAVKQEIAQTVTEGCDILEELNYLIQVLSADLDV
ncbi:MAG: sigma-70 family RNA polymerase sigma factor [Verrucomicrobiae bacterium]|nr:sigma-70 family RNA polymerase sigma factor [Verrucomicrobiae bacterium]